jgi:hypothetical protein
VWNFFEAEAQIRVSSAAGPAIQRSILFAGGDLDL